MFASLTTVEGGGPDLADTARMVGDTMLGWLRDFEGFRGLVVLTSDEAGRARLVTLWDDEDAARRSEPGRLALRDRMTATLGMRVTSTEPYEVAVFEVEPPA